MKLLIKVFKWAVISVSVIVIALFSYSYYLVKSFDTETLPVNHGKVNVELFLGKGEKQPLIVGFGGSEGGNAWASDHWKPQRDKYLAKGYSFLAIGYFGMEGTPEKLDRIALEGIHDAIAKAAQNPKVDGRCIAVMGGSKGGELVLTLGSHYKDIKAVVGIVPSHAVFTGLTDAMTTSSFTYQNKQLPFVPVPWSATPALLSGDLRKAFDIMLEDKSAVEKAVIKVEEINGPVFLISGTRDEFWPSAEMSDKVIERLKVKNFPYYYEHLAIEGSHNEPLKHFEKIDTFLDQHFKADQVNECRRK
ncbi:MAG: acyl-CoA thioester hydrolase/BAAT C-terminal domain-containing protein [Arenimonas sp.]